MKWLIAAIMIGFLAILANGLIVQVEDNSPGGLNNPDGKWIDVLKSPKPHRVKSRGRFYLKIKNAGCHGPRPFLFV